MKNKKKLMVFALMISFVSCNLTRSSSKQNDQNIVEIVGTLQEQGMTSYQYGTHTLANYALKSEIIDLNEYINVKVTVTGHKVEGYPIDGGPEYIEVEQIKIIK